MKKDIEHKNYIESIYKEIDVYLEKDFYVFEIEKEFYNKAKESMLNVEYLEKHKQLEIIVLHWIFQKAFC